MLLSPGITSIPATMVTLFLNSSDNDRSQERDSLVSTEQVSLPSCSIMSSFTALIHWWKFTWDTNMSNVFCPIYEGKTSTSLQGISLHYCGDQVSKSDIHRAGHWEDQAGTSGKTWSFYPQVEFLLYQGRPNFAFKVSQLFGSGSPSLSRIASLTSLQLYFTDFYYFYKIPLQQHLD